MDFGRPLSERSDTELIQMLEEISAEVKRRNTLMITGSESREDMIQKVVRAILPNIGKVNQAPHT
jgi:hypothetical protein